MILENFEIQKILEKTASAGYCFRNFENFKFLEELKKEVQSLELKEGDHINYPINQRFPNQTVKQLHIRSYHQIDDPKVPIASRVSHTLSEQFKLENWLLNEIGYQIYRDERDWISPHRDRESDQLLSLTLTIYGSAWINIYQSEVNPPDYNKLVLIDQFLTVPGTMMFLRAPGLGSGERVIHEVCPPINGERAILNLRMRPTILKSPEERNKNLLLKK